MDENVVQIVLSAINESVMSHIHQCMVLKKGFLYHIIKNILKLNRIIGIKYYSGDYCINVYSEHFFVNWKIDYPVNMLSSMF